MPDTLFIPDYIRNMFTENSQYYVVKNVTLSSLIDPGFVTSFVQNGNCVSHYLLLLYRMYKSFVVKTGFFTPQCMVDVTKVLTT